VSKSEDASATGIDGESGPGVVDSKKAIKANKDKKRKKGGLGTSRGVETMFRTSYRVHMDLSGLADAKANIMISINGLIISITLAAVGPNIARNEWLLLPTSVLLIGCSVALVFAVLSARPRVSSQKLTLEEVAENDANILFFGNFVNLTEVEFVEGMKDLMQDTEHLYVNMIRDLYGLGCVLQKKFRLLRMSYNIFMVSLLLGVALFVAVFATDLGSAHRVLQAAPSFPG
jgi:Pycsar effector protein